MKAFIAAILATAVIGAGAWYGLNHLGFSSAERFSKEGSVRID
jgi:hypothetical protein